MNMGKEACKWQVPAVFIFYSALIVSSYGQTQIQNHIQLAAESTCEGTLYPQLCTSTISTFPDLHKKSLREIIAGIIKATISEVYTSEKDVTGLKRERKNLLPIDERALNDCIELLQETVAEFKKSLSYLAATNDTASSKHIVDLETLLSAAMTDQYTCLDGLYGDKKLRAYIEGGIERISQHVSNCLAILKKLKKTTKKKSTAASDVDNDDFPFYGTQKDGFPKWLKKKDRSLLQAPIDKIKIDLVVAKDGSGNFKTINEALAAAPDNSRTRFVIHIKKGEYHEYVEVTSRKRNIMFVGDGIGKTWIKGNRSVKAGWPTFDSHTVAVVGVGFIGRDISIENYAGPIMEQAVALRSNSDFSAFYNCSFIAYQDTLYVHSFRQFYTHCDIYGTIDFIFGNAAVVFQRCNLYARKPIPGQSNIYTAQGRDDPNQNTGISIIDCKVAAAADLIPVQHQFRTYLGRPWKIYSVTVFLLSKLEDVVDPKGWLEWNGDIGLKTLYYGEYKNRGAGSDTSDRVDWPGFRVITSSTEANQFTVANFIEGEEWLPETGLPFYPDLIPAS